MKGRILELDSVRGFAALAIVLAHGQVFGKEMSDNRWVLSAVDLFFVLSSFLITTLILRYRQEPGFLRAFYLRRFLRIWPPYYVALAACMVLNRYYLWDDRAEAWPWYMTFTQNLPYYLRIEPAPMSQMFLHTWTLAIEEQFYVIWPLLLRHAGRKRLIATAVIFVLLPPVLRQYHYLEYLLLTRSDGLGLGAVLALLLYNEERFKRNLIRFRLAFLLIAGLALTWTTGASLINGLPQPFFYTRVNLIYFSLVGLVVSAQGASYLAILRDKRLCYLGTISYALYLYHPLVYGAFPQPYRKLVINDLGFDVKWVEKTVMIGMCFLCAEVSRRFIEAPVLRYKDKLAYRAPRAA
ncbi:MAG: acyltransferase [Planctomycetota bacterium]|nr:acyltransferase [Planctomycetota bacterium]